MSHYLCEQKQLLREHVLGVACVGSSRVCVISSLAFKIKMILLKVQQHHVAVPGEEVKFRKLLFSPQASAAPEFSLKQESEDTLHGTAGPETWSHANHTSSSKGTIHVPSWGKALGGLGNSS